MESQLFLGMRAVVASQPMRRLMGLARRAARTGRPVLITGESGAGKELLARALHCFSPRRDRPWVEVHCGALRDGRIEDELFELAHTGTLFLDEIGELGSKAQAKLALLLAGQRKIPADVRVLAATSRDLADAARAGRFHGDLYERLTGIHLRVPPLRERHEDVGPLAEFFLRQSNPDARLTNEARLALERYGWPGNVRELRQMMTAVAVENPGSAIGDWDLPEQVLGGWA